MAIHGDYTSDVHEQILRTSTGDDTLPPLTQDTVHIAVGGRDALYGYYIPRDYNSAVAFWNSKDDFGVSGYEIYIGGIHYNSDNWKWVTSLDGDFASVNNAVGDYRYKNITSVGGDCHGDTEMTNLVYVGGNLMVGTDPELSEWINPSIEIGGCLITSKTIDTTDYNFVQCLPDRIEETLYKKKLKVYADEGTNVRGDIVIYSESYIEDVYNDLNNPELWTCVKDFQHTHIVETGDTFSGMARGFGITLEEFYSANPGSKGAAAIYNGEQYLSGLQFGDNRYWLKSN